jgi:hypothetical protein
MKLRKHINGGDAARIAVESNERDPVQIEPLPADDAAGAPTATTGATAPIPVGSGSISQPTAGRKRPPRLRKPIPRNDQCFAPTADLEGHRAALRQAFGYTLGRIRLGPTEQADIGSATGYTRQVGRGNPQRRNRHALIDGPPNGTSGHARRPDRGGRL